VWQVYEVGESMKEILYFSATWCVPCRQMKPILEQVEAETGIKITKIDIEEGFASSQKYGVRSVPTFVLLEEGKEISRTIGAQTSKELATALSL
jgi:thioredoxin 1